MKFRRIALATLLAATALLQLGGQRPAAAYPTAQVQLEGHGFGHGRGLSQYGAYGYSLAPFNWNHEQILDHYYSNTTMGTVSNVGIGVRILVNDEKDMIVTSGSTFTVGGRTYSANTAARIRLNGSSHQFYLDEAPGCGGPWTQVATPSGPVLAVPTNGNQGATNPDVNQFLKLCVEDAQHHAYTTTYRGNLKAVDDGGKARTVNEVLLEDYLLGVIPRESPASWASTGGAEALKAQAVAARSYSIAAPSYSYATTCDSTACQVYGGVAKDGVTWEDSRTNTAVAETAGQVRRFSDNSVARTEFSSSTGGYSAGGAFPAVVDEGDAIAANPNHHWTASIDVSAIESRYSSIGSLQGIVINQRNGLGEWNGRVKELTLIGSSGSVTITGDAFRGLANTVIKSDWFNVLYQPSGGISGYWLMGSDGGIFSFAGAQFYGSMGGQRLNQPVVDLSPTPDTHGYWLVARDGGVFAFGNAQFYGSMGGQRLNQPVVAMTPTPDGQGYWQVASDGGIFAFGNAQFYGSMGGQRLNKPIVGMASTPSGHGYWLVASDGGIFAFGDAQFKGSTGSLSLKQSVVGIAATSSGDGYWMLAGDGGIFAFGDAPYKGSLPGNNVNATATGITATATGQGYVISTSNGGVNAFGDGPFLGNMFTAVPGFKGEITGIARVLE